MAKYGEGDKRWIVKERADGTNVNNWHWSEKDCLDWSKRRLGALLSGVSVTDAKGTGITVTTQSLDKVDGEAYINIRKGKVIPAYSLENVTVSWTGKVDGDDSAGTVRGNVAFPYIADENADEDPAVIVTVSTDSPEAEKFRQVLVSQKEVLLAKIREFVEEFKAGGPAREELEKNQTKDNAASVPKTAQPLANEAPAAPAPPPKKKEVVVEGFKTITLAERFHCRPHDVFEILLDENRWKGLTQSNAKLTREVGGEFMFFDGAVTGVYEQIEQDKLIAKKWRFASWPDGIDSKVTLTFEEPDIGTTIVRLTQTNVPEEDRYGNATVVENTERGWRDLIFHRIRAIFGYGI